MGDKGYTVAINAEKVLKYRAAPDLKRIVDASILPYPDGAGAVIGLKWLHGLASEKINMPVLALEFADTYNIRTFIVGATSEVHDLAITKIHGLYPDIDLVGSMHGYSPVEEIIKQIVRERPQLILLALGSPRQEEFASEILENTEIGVVIGCGGALDIIAGRLKRAPKFWIDNNLEWAYRAIQEPWRLKRQLFLPKFLFHLVVEKIRQGLNRSLGNT